MTKREPVEPGKDQLLLRLELYVDPNNTEDAEATLKRLLGAPKVELDEKLTDTQLAELACRIYESRRVRAKFLSSSLLGEPVWDMLLALFCFSHRGEFLSISGLCQASGVPESTALRRVQIMEQRKLIARRRDVLDGRRTWVKLSHEGLSLMKQYLATIHRSLAG